MSQNVSPGFFLPAQDPNVGHGHVYRRPDGAKAKCGGPMLCSLCAAELANKQTLEKIMAPLRNHHDRRENAREGLRAKNSHLERWNSLLASPGMNDE